MASMRFAWFVFSAGAVLHRPVIAQNNVNCAIPVVTPTRKVAFDDDTTEKDLCDIQMPKVTDAVMANKCDEFCKIGGKHLGLPLLLGAATYGFSLSQMDEVCRNSSLAIDDDVLLDKCERDSQALVDIKSRASDFTTKVRVFKASQLAFRAEMAKDSIRLQEELKSEAFKTQMLRTDDKAGEFRNKVEDFKANVDQFKADTLKEAVNDLKSSGKMLDSTVKRNMDIFDDYTTACNNMYLVTGRQKEFLLDICAQGSEDCIDATDAGQDVGVHVGCCCAANPLTLDASYEIEGVSSGTINGRVGHRRLAGESNFNLCASAKQQSKGQIDATHKKIRDMGMGHLVDEYQDKLERAYPEYFATCVNGRRLEALKDEAENQPEMIEQAEDERLNAIDAQDRRLQQLNAISCKDSDVSVGDWTVELKVHDQARDKMCSEWPLTTDDMAAQCDAFCAPDGISLLLGTSEYGFNLDDVKQILFKEVGGVFRMDHDLEADCQDWGAAFYQIELYTKDFTTQLNVFEAEKVKYAAVVAKSVGEVQTFIASDEFKQKLKRERITRKAALFAEEVSKRVDVNLNSAKRNLDREATALRKTMDNLFKALEKHMGELEKFIDQCNDFYVARTRKDIFLLDICAQQNTKCIDHANAGRVSCACAYNPVASLGKQKIDDPIDGDILDRDDIPTGNGSRRLSSRRLSARTIDICAGSWTEAREDVLKTYNEITERLGQEQTIQEYNDGLVSKYGNDFCAFAGHSSSPSLGGSPSPSGGSPSPSGGSPSPGGDRPSATPTDSTPEEGQQDLSSASPTMLSLPMMMTSVSTVFLSV